MKPSLYNIFAPHCSGEGKILFNSKTGVCVVLSDDELAQYHQIEEGSLDEGQLYDRLAELGFLVANTQAELDFLRYQFEKHKFDNTLLQLSIAPSLDTANTESVFSSARPGLMSQEVQDATVAYVREQCICQPFKILRLRWLLVDAVASLDVICALNPRIAEVCAEYGVDFHPSVLLVGDIKPDQVREPLAQAGVNDISTVRELQACLHDVAQPSENEDFVQAIAQCASGEAFDLGACVDLRQGDAKCDGGASSLSIGDMGSMTNFVSLDTKKTSSAQYKERALALLDEFLASSPSKEDFERYLNPLRTYCEAFAERSYALDELGNAYECSFDLGRDDLVLFNVCEPLCDRVINRKRIAKYGNANPLDLKECASCRVFPLCQGGCARVRIDENLLTCIPQRFIVEELLTAYSRVL